MKRPGENELWLLAGYAVWFCLIYALWQVVQRLPALYEGSKAS